MNARWMLKPLLIGAAGAALGASSMMFVPGGSARLPSPTAAVASGEDDQQRIVEAVKHVEPSVVALDVTINGTRVMPADPFGSFFGPGFGWSFGSAFGNSRGAGRADAVSRTGFGIGIRLLDGRD